jgi:hypothetical protein
MAVMDGRHPLHAGEPSKVRPLTWWAAASFFFCVLSVIALVTNLGGCEGDVFVDNTGNVIPKSKFVPRLVATAVVTAILPIVWFVRYRARRRDVSRWLSRQCTKCGYDLRSSSDRCPECGTPSKLIPPSIRS